MTTFVDNANLDITELIANAELVIEEIEVSHNGYRMQVKVADCKRQGGSQVVLRSPSPNSKPIRFRNVRILSMTLDCLPVLENGNLIFFDTIDTPDQPIFTSPPSPWTP